MTTAPELAPLTRPQPLAEQAYQAIREGIATGLFGAGQCVTERSLAGRLKVSPTPVREALRRLEQEGLIERVSARKLRVVDHSPATLRELMLASAALRAMEARFATQKITDAALVRMAALVDALAAPQADQTGLDLLRIAREFEMEIEKAADNAALRALIESLSVVGQERRARSIEFVRRHTAIAAERLQGYRDILAALCTRDPDAVEKTFRRQVTVAVDLMLGELQ
jgi:DNA-binding GntR family transcriptional regulator